MSVDEHTLVALARHAAHPMAIVTGPPWAVVGHGSGWPPELLDEESSNLAGTAAGAAATRLCALAALTASARHIDVRLGRRRRRLEATPVPDTCGVGHLVLALRERPVGRSPVAGRGDGRLVARFGPDLRVTEVNDAVVRASGLDRSQMLGRTNRELGYPPELAELWDRHHATVLATGRPVEISYDLPGVDGTRRYRTMVLPDVHAEGGVFVISTAADHADEEPVERHTSQVERSAAGVTIARREVAEHCRSVGAEHMADAVELVVSELVGNAVEHGSGATVDVEGWRMEHLYQLSVRQAGGGDGPPPPKEWTMPPPTSRRGRGLAIVRALADAVELRRDAGSAEIRCTFDVGSG